SNSKLLIRLAGILNIPTLRSTLFSKGSGDTLALNSFPTRRSSDLGTSPLRLRRQAVGSVSERCRATCRERRPLAPRRPGGEEQADRKSTRLNSSHVAISYAVFCLKKKQALSCFGSDVYCFMLKPLP